MNLKILKIIAKKRIIKNNLKPNNYILGILYNKNINKSFYFININNICYNNYNYFYIYYNKKKYLSIIKEIQYHPISDKIIHIDFFNLKKNQIINTKLNIKFIGKPLGVNKGGILEIIKTSINVRGIYKYIPEFLFINIKHLNINDKFYVKNIIRNNDKYFIKESVNNIICYIKNIKKKTVVKNKK
ncbi:MAG: 50S ribosomal protein L25 [Candidatus Shikimatogenerans sp. AspAUS03]|uniref:50S ribosomal protein L25 n=1 Tax=Candidatus Shikimatogenerans sp. AspAUS03 TaxID=3158563 RepID=A0AAU7QUT3_9FLAO